MNWASLAACRGMDPDLFVVHNGDNETVKAAKAVCAECQVRERCLDEALRLGPSRAVGVWGGTSERERRRMRAKAS